MCLFVCVFVRDIFLYNHLLLCHDYPSLRSNFYHQGKTTNSISYFCVTITDVLVQTFNNRGKYKWRHSSSIPTRTRWRLAPLKFKFHYIINYSKYFDNFLPAIVFTATSNLQLLLWFSYEISNVSVSKSNL